MSQSHSNAGPTVTRVSAPAAAAGPRISGRSSGANSATRSLTSEKAAGYVWVAARLAMGWTFLWPFMDKLFGLGHETASADSWINGGNPTKGFLAGSIGPFSGFYHSIAGGWLVNVLFMTGLLVIAVGLLLGIFMKFACGAGALMVLLMWSASLPPANNVFMDEHVVYALLLVGLALVGAGKSFGFGRQWSRLELVKQHAWLG